ncbi:chromate efflux transporter [Caulobacter sp. 17J65-9]|uniref:chromate efflux transporter n=1 Tax=Caulobacter sp. 17J65-9 TaxID=2709382 RepID=UPI0013C73AC4|nr:chromate efflux transporter [Caulobacter sp. 17J65-9]NEX92460.1 chromate efflux transporter [Caulobacter sp. 17J65-9]
MKPSFAEALRVWLKVGVLGFGGPAGQIALLHREVVERRGWFDEARFQHALSFCLLLPGPEAQQLATYLGWLLHGVRGGLAAGLLFVLPGFAVIVALSAAYVTIGDVPDAQAVMLGVKAAVVGILLQALIRVASRSLTGWPVAAVAGVAFVAMTLFAAPFPLVVIAAGLLGFVLAPRGEAAEKAAPVKWGPTLVSVLVWTAVWLVPLVGIGLAFGPHSSLAQMGGFFSRLAAFSFGGAYAALAYAKDAAVNVFGWLDADQMLDGLGLAETTPGPLILVLVYVGFVGGWNTAPVGLSWLWAVVGSLVAGWAIFAPSFLWIFAGAPHVERLRSSARLSGALRFVGAAVVGVIASLGVWFAGRLLIGEEGALEIPAAGLTALGLIATFGLRWGVLRTLALCAFAGWAWGRLGLA